MRTTWILAFGLIVATTDAVAAGGLRELSAWTERTSAAMGGDGYTRTLELLTGDAALQGALRASGAEDDSVCEDLVGARLGGALEAIADRLEAPQPLGSATPAGRELAARMSGEEARLCESVGLVESETRAVYFQVYYFKLGPRRLNNDVALVAKTSWLLRH